MDVAGIQHHKVVGFQPQGLSLTGVLPNVLFRFGFHQLFFAFDGGNANDFLAGDQELNVDVLLMDFRNGLGLGFILLDHLVDGIAELVLADLHAGKIGLGQKLQSSVNIAQALVVVNMLQRIKDPWDRPFCLKSVKSA